MNETGFITSLKVFITERLLPQSEASRALTPQTPLVSSGLLDSLAMVELLAYLEELGRVRIEAHEVDWTKLDTMEAIESFVRSKQSTT